MTLKVYPGRRSARSEARHVLIIPAIAELDLRERRIEWDTEDRIEVEHARAIFEESVNAGMTACRIEPAVPHVFGGYCGSGAGDTTSFATSAGKGTFITSFDENAERIVMIPPLRQ